MTPPPSPVEPGPDPVLAFTAWFAEAVGAGEPEPEATALATVDPDGSPAVRFVLLKGWDAAGFTFFTNAGSDKGRHLADRGRAALALRWTTLDRQVRVVGPASPAAEEESDAYWATRSRRSQLGAWASRQSRPLGSRAELEEQVAAADRRFGDGLVPRPAHWHGWRVQPDTVELWQGRPNRLHDRWRYERHPGGAWVTTRLSP